MGVVCLCSVVCEVVWYGVCLCCEVSVVLCEMCVLSMMCGVVWCSSGDDVFVMWCDVVDVGMV